MANGLKPEDALEQWNEIDKLNKELGRSFTLLKGIEAHALKDGKSIFISKDKKESWPEGDTVVHFKGAGYFVAGYESATMSGWNVEKSTVVQFDGDAKEFAETIPAL